MFRRTALAAAALLAAGALLLTACTGGAEPDPDDDAPSRTPTRPAVIRLVLEPTNLDIRQTGGCRARPDPHRQRLPGPRRPHAEQDIVPRARRGLRRSPTTASTYTFTAARGRHLPRRSGTHPAGCRRGRCRPRKDTPDVERLGAPRERRLDHRRRTGRSSLTPHRARLELPVEPHRPRRPRPQGGRHDRLQTKAERHRPVHPRRSWKQGDSITFARNDDYWGEPAQVAEVVFDYIPDYTGRRQRGAGRRGRRAHRVRREPRSSRSRPPATSRSCSAQSTDKATLAFNNAQAPAGRQARAPGHPSGDRPRRARRGARRRARPCTARSRSSTPATKTSPTSPRTTPKRPRRCSPRPAWRTSTLTLTIPSFYATTIPQVLVSDLNEVGVTLEVDSVEFPTWLDDVYIEQRLRPQLRAARRGARLRELGQPGLLLQLRQPRGAGAVRAVPRRDRRGRQPPTCSRRPRRIVSEDTAADWLYNGASVIAVGPNVTRLPRRLNVNARLNLAELAKSDRVIRYTLTRLALLLLGLLVASVLIFLTLRVLPGDVAQLIAGTNGTPEQVAGDPRAARTQPAAARCSTSTGSAASSAATSARRCSPAPRVDVGARRRRRR